MFVFSRLNYLAGVVQLGFLGAIDASPVKVKSNRRTIVAPKDRD